MSGNREQNRSEQHTAASVLRWEDSGGAMVVSAEDYDALLADTLTLMDQHASDEVQMEARRRILERHAEAKP